MYITDNDPEEGSILHYLDDNRSSFFSSHEPTCTQDDYTCGMIIRMIQVGIRKLFLAYLENPWFMALLPLLYGIGIGWILGRATAPAKKSSRSVANRSAWYSPMVGYAWTCAYPLVSFLYQSSLAFFFWKTRKSSTLNWSWYGEDIRNREDDVRCNLKSDAETTRECDVELSEVPKHIAVVMDGNRRYGKMKYGSATKGHWDGSSKLVEFAKWCLAEGVQILTVYAFSTENWYRSPEEVASLMTIFCKYCDELREEAAIRGIRIEVLSTDTERLPVEVKEGLSRMVRETSQNKNLILNVCLSYGARSEILNAVKSLMSSKSKQSPHNLTEDCISQHLLTKNVPDPDLLIRTSGEMRLSNFLLWQVAYSEFFFMDKMWPEVEKSDLVDIIRKYANGRKRRFGK